MRQSLRRAARPAFLQPCSYIGQCEATQGGCRKLAEIGVQPRSAAAITPFEKGATTVTTIGGRGRVERLAWPPRADAPLPSPPARRLSNLPFLFYGGARGPH